MPFYPFLGEGSPTQIDYRKKGTLILTSPLEDLHEPGLRGPSYGGWLRNPFARTTLKLWVRPVFVGIYMVSQVMRNGFRPSTVVTVGVPLQTIPRPQATRCVFARSPSKVPTFTDSFWLGGFPYQNRLDSNLSTGGPSHEPPSGSSARGC